MISRNEILSQIKMAVTSVDAGAEVILFGSQARGDYNEDSDWDVMIITEKEVNRNVRSEFRKSLYDIEFQNEICISLIIRNRSFWQTVALTDLYKNIEEEGILL